MPYSAPLWATTPHEPNKFGMLCAFTGLLALGTWRRSMSLSETPLQHTTQLSQLSDMLRYIIGDFEVLVDDWEQVEVEVVHGLGCVD